MRYPAGPFIAQVPDEAVQPCLYRQSARLLRTLLLATFRSFLCGRILRRIAAHDLAFLVQNLKRDWRILAYSFGFRGSWSGFWLRRLRRGRRLIFSGLFSFR